jgi:uncharacterized membrane protein (GlpM family)
VTEMVIRFAIGGIVVTLFSLLAEVFRPKSFAGLFGAAPSIALATVGLTIRHEGRDYAALEARSMILGSIAFLAYAISVSWLLRKYKPPVFLVTLAAMPVWFLVSFALLRLVAGSVR